MKASRDLLAGDPAVVALEDEYPAGFVDPMHSHGHIQVLYASAGVMAVRTLGASYVVPPQRALWLPTGVEHEVRCRGAVSLRTLYIRPDLVAATDRCRAFEVSHLLKALILEAVTFGRDMPLDGREGRVIALLLEEIRRMPDTAHQVAMPADPRLVRVCGHVLDAPADPRDLSDWAHVAGMGRRTFTRAFRKETGMSFATWRQQARLMDALALLSAGHSITRVAYEVGYESPSSFSVTFRRAFGVSPTEYRR